LWISAKPKSAPSKSGSAVRSNHSRCNRHSPRWTIPTVALLIAACAWK